MQYLQVPTQTRSRRRQSGVQVAHQAPLSTTQPPEVSIIYASNMRAYEKEIEQDFQAQVQPILQTYLQKTRRPNPINSVFDMSNHVNI
jgi:hypothetical protein